MTAKRRGKITGSSLKRQDVNRRRSVGNPRNANADLFGQADVGALAVTIRIRAQSQINSLRRVYEIEMRGPTEPAGADRSMSALEATATGHVEFINNCATIDIGDSNVQRQKRLAGAKTTMAVAILVKLPIWRFCFDSCSCKTNPVCASTMMNA